MSTSRTQWNKQKCNRIEWNTAECNGTKKSLVPFVPNLKIIKNSIFLPKNAISSKAKKHRF
jgi:hypothetical protein